MTHNFILVIFANFDDKSVKFIPFSMKTVYSLFVLWKLRFSIVVETLDSSTELKILKHVIILDLVDNKW